MNPKPDTSLEEECRRLREVISGLEGTVERLESEWAQEKMKYQRKLHSRRDAVMRRNLQLVLFV